MMETVTTDAAPGAIGTYSQAVKVNGFVYVSGQIGLDPKTMQMVLDDFTAQATQAFHNLSAIANASGCSLQNAVKLTVYVTDLGNFEKLTEIMAQFMREPYPARTAVQVGALPKDALIEIDAVLSA